MFEKVGSVVVDESDYMQIIELLNFSSFLPKNKKSHGEANVSYNSRLLSSGMIFAIGFLKALLSLCGKVLTCV